MQVHVASLDLEIIHYTLNIAFQLEHYHDTFHTEQ